MCVCAISWGPVCTIHWIPPPPHSPSKEPGPRAFCTFPGGCRPRSRPGDTRLGPWRAAARSREWDSPHLPVPMTIFLNWVLSYLHIWLLWDHSWGRVWGSPVTQQPPGLSLCLSPPVESLGPESALCFYSYFVLICKLANSGPCPVECGWSLMYIIKYFCHNSSGLGIVWWPWGPTCSSSVVGGRGPAVGIPSSPAPSTPLPR